MSLEKLNPTTPGRAFIGFGYQISSTAIKPEYNTTAAIVQKLQRHCRVSEHHAATIVRLAALGPEEGR